MAIATQDPMLAPVDAVASEDLEDLGADVSAVANAVARAAEDRRRDWLEESAAAFEAQSAWHDRYGHPLSDILASPGGTTWT